MLSGSGVSKIEALARLRRYAASQGITIDSPRAVRYAASQGLTEDDVDATAVDNTKVDNTEAVRHYAESLNLSVQDPVVRKYAQSATAPEDVDSVSIDASVDNNKFKCAVLHYAQSLGLDVDDSRVVKYAKGLLKPSGDFSVERRAEVVAVDEVERKIKVAVEKYAMGVGLPVYDHRIVRYESKMRAGPFKHLLEAAKSQA